MEIDNIIRNHALKNALDHKGSANPKAIMGKIMGTHAEWREKRQELAVKIDSIVKEVNALSVDDQRAALVADAPEMLEKKKKEDRDIFAFFGIKEGETVVTSFPPGPEKYPHIGHAKAAMMNYLMAKQHGGEFKLRFEDTNPKLVQDIFYDIIQENLKWLGVEWSELIYASDHMERYYSLCEKAINDGNAYVCSCDGEGVHHSRETGEPCSCRGRGPDENLELWKNMPNLPVGHAIVRLKIDLEHKNTTMRDPTIFRILDEPHARQGKKYRVWPNYDWQNSIMDSDTGVTHRIRSKEFELRNELQRYVQKICGLRETSTYEIGRFNFVGVVSSGRVIREGIEKGEFVGWDDPSLTTIVALRRRGFQPKALMDFLVSTGLSKAEATLTWDDVVLHNKRLLDAEADRFFFVRDPVELWVKGATEEKVEMDLHPEHRKGGREFNVHDNFWITKQDMDCLSDGKLYRLMDCLNFRKQTDGFEFTSREVSEYKEHGEKIMHWLPRSDNLVDVEIMMPDKTVVCGLAEVGVGNVREGQVIQFERFGFCRLDAVTTNNEGGLKLVFWYTHK